MALLNTGAAPAATAAAEKAVGGTSKSAKGTEYQRQQKQKKYEAAVLLQKALQRANVQLSADESAALDLLVRAPGTRAPGSASFGTPIIYRIFGNSPKVGDKVTSLEIFQKTQKGIGEIRQLCNKWKSKGTIVEYDADTKSYVIKAVGQLPAVGEKE